MRRVGPESVPYAGGQPVNMAGRRQSQPRHHHRHHIGPGIIQETITHSLRRRRRSAGQDYSAVNPFLKYFLFIINFLFMLVGLALIAATAYVLNEKGKTVSSFAEFAFDLSCILCLVGCIVFVVAFFGCGGALRESVLFLKIYYISLSLLFFLEIIVIIFLGVFYFVDGAFADIGWYPEDYFRDGIKSYRNDPDVQDFIDDFQEFFECCGSSNDEEGYLDWNENLYFNCSSTNPSPERCSVPFSCCRIQEGDQVNYKCGHGMLDSQNTDKSAIYTTGCLKGLQKKITDNDNIWKVGGAVLGIVIPQAIFICLAKALLSQIREQMAKW